MDFNIKAINIIYVCFGLMVSKYLVRRFLRQTNKSKSSLPTNGYSILTLVIRTDAPLKYTSIMSGYMFWEYNDQETIQEKITLKDLTLSAST